MGAYILRRLLLMVPTLLGIMIINFTLVQFVPGGPVEQIIARLEDADYEGHSLSMLQRIAEALGQRLEVSFVPATGTEG